MVRKKGKPPKAWIAKMKNDITGQHPDVSAKELDEDVNEIWRNLSPFRKRQIKKTFGSEEERVDPTKPGGLTTNTQIALEQGLQSALASLYSIKTTTTNNLVSAGGEVEKRKDNTTKLYYEGRQDALNEIMPLIDRAIAKTEVRMQMAIVGSKKELSRGLEHRREIEEIQAKKPKEIGGGVDPVTGKVEAKFTEKSALGGNDDNDRTDPKKRFEQRFERL